MNDSIADAADIDRRRDAAATMAAPPPDGAKALTESLRREAIAAHDAGARAIAERLYRRLICLEPKTNIYRYLFKIHRERGDPVAGARLLRRARVVEPGSAVVAALLADLPPGAVPPADPGAVLTLEGAPSEPPPEPGETPGPAVAPWLLAGLAVPLVPVCGAALAIALASGQPWWWMLAAGVLGLLTPLALMELYGFARLTGETGAVMAPARRLVRETNSYIAEVTGQERADGAPYRRRPFATALTPHPYLAYVNRPPADPEHPFRSNNYGFFNRPFPYQRDPACFNLLVTGGSVATQFAQMRMNGPRYLEDALNRRYRPPKGDRFVVLNGALGGWRYPQQVGIAAMTASAVDAVVTLDGFNEAAMMLRDGVLIETPGRKFLMSNPVLEHGYERMVGDWLAGWIYALTLRYWWARNSSYLCLVSQRLRQAVQDSFDPGNDRSYLMRIFEMPKLGRAKRWEYAVRRYCDYQRFLHGACRQVGIRSAHFLQPIPGIGKPLSDAERGYGIPLGDGVVGLYRMMEQAIVAMARDEGMPSASLAAVFEGRSDTIYADWPHCIVDRATGASEGYRVMAEAMAGDLGRLWSLVERPAGPPQPAAREAVR